MVAIQMAVLDLMKSCIAELKSANPVVSMWVEQWAWLSDVSPPPSQLEMEEVTVETCLGKAFDVVVRHQLDPVWNQLVWNWDSEPGGGGME